MKRYAVAVLAGDGIGPEVMEQALRVLQAVQRSAGVRFDCMPALVGGAAYDRFGSHLPDETIEICRKADAILFGSVGGAITEANLPKWKHCEINSILALRKLFRFSCNFRPVKILPCLRAQSPLKAEVVQDGVDLLFVRELLGDVYFGEHILKLDPPHRSALDSGEYTELLCLQALHGAFTAARSRRKKVTLVHKANVLAMSKLWAEIGREVSLQYPDISYDEMLVDNCAMQLVLRPSQFDVLVTSNLFGDILSDLGAALPGTLGLSPSASINQDGYGLYEPAGGSAPDIAGRGIANPSAQILSAAMMLEHSFRLLEEASKIRSAVDGAYQQGFRTKDLNGSTSTIEFTDAVIQNLQ